MLADSLIVHCQVMTIFIGANNLCDACVNASYALPENFAAELNQTLAVCVKDIYPMKYMPLL